MASNNENFYNRLKDLSGIKPVNESKNEANSKTLVDYQRANNGTVYGVVKENHQYFIKKALVNEGEVKVTDFIYIDGVENKTKYQYNTVAEAEKQRNFYLRGINEAFDQGGVYFVNETTEAESPKLETEESFSSLVRKTINEGKKNIAEGREKKFKSTLPDNREDGQTSSKGLMPEAANVAVKKALGIVSEEVMVTADSEIKDADKVSEKKGKEAPEAPINDSNAKSKAEKATGKSKKDANKKPAAPDSLAVNQEDEVLKEGEDLVTADSEIITDESLANKVSQKHESPQAPINDGNAKSEAEKANAAGSASAAISNNVDDSPESEPFDDKENAGDEKGDIVTEDADKGQPFDDKAKVQGGGDEVTADSEEKDADRLDNETKVEKEQADYNNHNQPEKGHKEEKGEELKPVPSKKDIVAEADALVTADSEIEAANALANLTKTNLPDAIAEADAKEQPESEPFDDKENAGDEKDDIVAEADLSTADSEINADSSPANSKSNVKFNSGKLVQGTSNQMNDNAIAEADAKEQPESEPFDDKENAGDEKDDIVAEGLDEAGEEEIDAAADALGDLDVATDAEAMEEPAAAPEMGGEELGGEPEMGADDAEEPAMDVDGGEEDAGDAAFKELQKIGGKFNQKVSNTDLEPTPSAGLLKGVLSAFEDKIPEMDMEDRDAMIKILKNPESNKSDDGEEVAAEPEMGAEEGGEEVAAEPAAEPSGEFDSLEEPAEEPAAEPAMEEDAPMTVNGEEVIDEIPDGDGFESYMESRGYSKDNLGECSSSEMGSIVSGYVSDKDGEISEDEIKNIASYMDDNVATELEEYGHGDFAEKARPFMSEDGVSFGMTEPTLSPIEMEEEEIEDEIEDEIEAELGGDAPEEESAVVAVGEPADAPEEAPEMGFAPMADALGGGVVKPDGAKTKSVEVDVNAGTVKLEVSEGNVQVKNYIQNRIAELAGKKKPSMNESSKSDNLKKLDKLIEQQWKMFGDKMLNN